MIGRVRDKTVIDDIALDQCATNKVLRSPKQRVRIKLSRDTLIRQPMRPHAQRPGDVWKAHLVLRGIYQVLHPPTLQEQMGDFEHHVESHEESPRDCFGGIAEERVVISFSDVVFVSE